MTQISIDFLQNKDANPYGLIGSHGEDKIELHVLLDHYEEHLIKSVAVQEYTPEELLGKRVLASLPDQPGVIEFVVDEFSPDNKWVCISALPIVIQSAHYRHWRAFSVVDIKCILGEKKVDTDIIFDRNGIPIGPERVDSVVDYLNKKHCSVSSCVLDVMYKSKYADIYLCRYCYDRTLTAIEIDGWELIKKQDNKEDIPHYKYVVESYDKDPEDGIEYDGGSPKFHGGV